VTKPLSEKKQYGMLVNNFGTLQNDLIEWSDVFDAVEGFGKKVEKSAFIEHLTLKQQAELKKIIDEVFGK
jgi:hypothetical protein